jgi:linoleate 10R-lipoxygenase
MRAHSFLFLDVDASKAMNLEARVKEHIRDLHRHIRCNIIADVGRVRYVTSSVQFLSTYTALQLSIAGIVGTIQSLFSAKAKKQKLSVAESLFEDGATIDRTTNNVLSLLIGASVELSQCTYRSSDHGVVD